MKILDRPEISYFKASTDKVMANEEVVLEWEVQNAKKVRLDGVEQEFNHARIIVPYSKTFELTASSWNARVYASQTINLFTPAILRFETGSAFITEGVPTDIFIQLKHALSWKVIAEYTTIADKYETIAEGKIENGYNIFEYNFSIILKDACILRLSTKNGPEAGQSESVRVMRRSPLAKIFANQTVVKSGSPVKITWTVENVSKIMLYPGDIDVTGLNYYDFIPGGDRNIQLELRVTGDFGEQASAQTTLYLARIDNVYTSNNGDPENPEFYLNWSSTGLSQMLLLPDNIIVNSTETNFKINQAQKNTTYTLIGKMYNSEEIAESVVLSPCVLKEFRLENGSAIIGKAAVFHWSVKKAKRIQLRVSDRVGLIEILPQNSKYDLQVFSGTERATIIMWGDTNIIQSEMLIPRFVGPEIKTIRLPSISVQMGVSQMPSLAVNTINAGSLFSIKQQFNQRNTILFRVLEQAGRPSGWLLKKKDQLVSNYPAIKRQLNFITTTLIKNALDEMMKNHKKIRNYHKNRYGSES